MTAQYFRNATGTTVHRTGCPSQPAFPTWWNWAEGKTPAEIFDESAKHGIYHLYCKKCIPEGPA